MYQTTWVEVDFKALRHNLKMIRSLIGFKTRICAVIKADAYGHGVIPVAREMQKEGIDFFSTANLREALEVREAGIENSLLVMGWTPPEGFEEAIRHEIALTFFDQRDVSHLSSEAKKQGKKARVHLKMETGMNRIGARWEKEVLDLAQAVDRDENLILEGVFSHFSSSDIKDTPWVEEQLRRYKEGIKLIEKAGIHPGIKHMANSGGVLFYPDSYFDMVRPGCAMYGTGFDREVGLEPMMTLKTRVGMLKEIEVGETVGYSRCFTATRPSKIATVPIGYADGWTWGMKGFSWKDDKGQITIAGNVCMDQMMLDVTDYEELKIGDEIILFGQDCSARNEDIAIHAGISELEPSVRIGKRVPRIYID